MSPVYRAALLVSIAVGAVAAYSQKPSIPFDKLARDAQLQVLPAATHPAGATAAEAPPFALSATRLVSTRPVRPVRPRIVDRRFLLLNGAHLGMALFDVEMTQHCIAEHKCREGNPFMPSSQAAQIGVSLGSVAFTTVGSYWVRKHNLRIWWIAPAAGIAAHTAGVATGIANR